MGHVAILYTSMVILYFFNLEMVITLWIRYFNCCCVDEQ